MYRVLPPIRLSYKKLNKNKNQERAIQIINPGGGCTSWFVTVLTRLKIVIRTTWINYMSDEGKKVRYEKFDRIDVYLLVFDCNIVDCG